MRANAAPKQKCTPSRACPRNTTYPILHCNRANSRRQYRSDYRPSIKSLVGDNNTDRRQPASERGKVTRRVTLVRTTLGSENMDSANESGKHAAAAIGQASGLPISPVPIGTHAIQRSCEDYTLSVTIALRPVNATFSMYSFRCAPQKCLVPSEFTPQSCLSLRTTLLNGPTVARALRRPGAIGPKLRTTM
jgi:hypothetical protein